LNSATIELPAAGQNAPAALPADRVDFRREPRTYRHWQLDVAGTTATLRLDVDEDGGIRAGYKLKLNSYDLGVDIELADAIERLRFEHPGVKVVVITSAKERVFSSGANIYMLGTSSHAWKVNFCKFTNETRNGMEHASRYSGLKFIAAVNGSCAGGGYELALACDEIALVDDRSSAVSLPEVALLGVLPGTGGLTRLIDKRHVRPDRADVFCTTQEGQRAERARAWGLVDHIAKPAEFDALIEKRTKALAASSLRDGSAVGITLFPLPAQVDAKRLSYPHLAVDIDAKRRIATFAIAAPHAAIEDHAEAIFDKGANWYPLALARALDDAILQLRTNYLDIGTWVFTSQGDGQAIAAMDQVLLAQEDFWLVRETRNLWDRVLSRLDVSSRSLFALIEPGSCFTGTLLEIVLACDRSYMLLADDAARAPSVMLTEANRSFYRMINGQSRLATRFVGDAPALFAAYQAIGESLDASAAEGAGLVTFTPDDIDWDDEIRLALEERASLSPDALTGMEASLRFGGAETMATRIFGRLSAWQNWVFVRPNAIGDEGALKIFGTGRRPRFDWTRV
jgi:benzoyl-CoA-dihydrodiol lyase